MKRVIILGVWLLLSTPLFAQNNQINWSRNRALHDGSATNGLQLSGKGLYFNLVEKAPLLTQHQELVGRASNVGSFSISAQNPFIAHATNVASVGTAAGVVVAAKGIAFGATIRNYGDGNWPYLINQIADPLTDIRQRLVINYSLEFTFQTSDIPYRFGTYDFFSNSIDNYTWENPYCLVVSAAANNGKVTNPRPNTLPLAWEYDKLPGSTQTAKNTLVVGSVYDMALVTQNEIAYAYIDALSSAGPTDDLRVKPDLVAPGYRLTTAHRSDDITDLKSYVSTVNGTSMASPIVSGTALLLQEQFFARNKQYMRAATVKGLLLHTTDKISPSDGGNSSEIYTWGISDIPGPDPFTGFGLLNGTAAAKAISNRGTSSIIDEKLLISGQVHGVDIPTTPSHPVTVSISWLDPARYDPNVEFPASVNDKDPMLVNDLGVVVLERHKNNPAVTQTFYPYSLIQQNQRVSTVNDRPNRVDPYEKIQFIPRADHVYSIVVSPESAVLWNKSQPYTLIVTGLGPDDEPSNPACVAIKVITIPVQVGVHEEATTQITLGAEIAPQAGLTEFNAPNLLLTDGAVIHNADALLYNAACSRSGLRQVATLSTDSSATPNWLQGTEEREGELHIYPNPVGETCQLISKEAIETVWLYSLTGKLMGEQTSVNATEVTINTGSLPPGQYVLVVEAASGQKKSRIMTKF